MPERAAEPPVSANAPTPGPSFTAVVGLGSSAGGLEALTDVVAGLTPGGGATFVVAQHLAPDHPSQLVDLLSRVTRLSVVVAVDGADLQPDEIVIAPPRHDMEVVAGRLHVFEPEERVAPAPSVDVLFESIATEWGAKGVAVVLSGTGFDGSQGMRSVRATGGLAIAQTPETARFDSMPRAAIALGGADLVLSASEIGVRLSAIGRGADWLGESLPEPEPVVLTTVAAQLKRALGIDFSRYKESTLRRQLQRRMAVRQVSTIEDYLPILAADPVESHQLARHLLVTVTSFFRDPASFAALAERLKDEVAERESNEPLRVWVAGCATGEELYSIAMLCSEALGRPASLERHLKIFGTDLDESSLTIGRRGLYPLSVTARIPLELRALYTSETPLGLEMSPELRDCAVFARHNIGENPPFPRMDLVSFRNTLIYFTVPLQERVLELLRYSLVPGGLLFLGNSESLGTSAAGFRVLDGEHKIFEHLANDRSPFTPSRAVGALSFAAPAAVGRRVPARRDAPDPHSELLEALARSFAQPCLVVDEALNLVEVIGDVSAFCRVPEGRLSTAAGDFLRPELQAEASALMAMARTSHAPALGRSLHIAGLDGEVQIEARPLRVGARDLMLLSFASPLDPLPGAASDVDTRLAGEFERLERELMSTQDSLRQTVSELESLNEELETSSEELQATSEELQAFNEELEASNEELRASNEELVGVNQLLRVRSDEQDALNADLENIQRSSSQGMVIIDADRRITRFTPLAVRLFALLESDIGTSILKVPCTVAMPGLEAALDSVLRGEPKCTLEAAGPDRSFLVHLAPYQHADGRRRGAVLTLTDVTELIALQHFAVKALRDFERVADALEEAVWRRDPTMQRLEYISGRIERITGWTAAELIEDPQRLDACIAEDERERVEAARALSSKGWSVEYRLVARDGTVRWVRESAATVPEGDDPMIVGTMADISERVGVQQQASDLSLVFEAVFENQSYGVAVLDTQARVVMPNQTFCALVGYDAASVLGRPIFVFGHADERSLADECLGRLAADHPGSAPTTHHLLRSDGQSLWVTLDVRRLARPVGESAAFVIVQDVTLLHDRTERLSRQARFDESGTGLLNRAAFRSELGRKLAGCERAGDTLALVWLDLDRFKEINDQHGHEAGDAVLKTVAQRMSDGIRTDDLLGRLGGDEFGIAMSSYGTVGELEKTLDRLLVALAEPIVIGDLRVTVSGSFGVAFSPGDSSDLDGLMRSADAAMYVAKTEGGHASGFFTEELNQSADERRSMRAAISTALGQREFELYYQPIVTTDGRVLQKVESVLRWNRDGRVVVAGDFIAFAEDSGQIRELGPHTFALLRADLDALRTAGHGSLPVGINMSATQLEDRSLAAQLSDWPTSTGLQGLVIEVVESVFLPGRSRALDALKALAAHGAELSIDDFGTGFSNLQLLQMLSPTYIKLDKTFLDVSMDPARGSLLLRAAVDIAHAVGAAVVAEGVETEAQLALVREMGVEYVQGFLIAPPMPLAALLEWIAANTPTSA